MCMYIYMYCSVHCMYMYTAKAPRAVLPAVYVYMYVNGGHLSVFFLGVKPRASGDGSLGCLLRHHTLLLACTAATLTLYVCWFLCMYVCIYIRVTYILIRPPIPYITSSRCKRLHKFRPKKFLLHKRTNTTVPHCNDLNFFLNL